MNVVLGARGRIGQALALSLPPNRLATPERSTYSDWWRADAADDVCRYCEALGSEPGFVYVASGVTDPSRSYDEHDKVNYSLAQNVVLGATRLGYRVVTFGTVMEVAIAEHLNNPYYRSKLKLGRFIEQFAKSGASVVHIRLHTVFGGRPPDAFTFLGQMLRALASRSEFRMSPGNQLREYHHIDDEVCAISSLASRGARGAVDLSHGQAISLRDLATYIFRMFGCPELLKVGALPAPTVDNFDVLFKPTPGVELSFRPALPAVLDYLKQCVALPA